MTKRVASKKVLICLAVAMLVVTPLAASAHDGWGHGGDWHHHGWGRGDWHRDNDWHRGGYWHDGHWVAGAIIAGAVAGLVDGAVAPAPAYYAPPPTVVYTQPTVIYQSAPVVTRTVVYSSPYGY